MRRVPRIAGRSVAGGGAAAWLALGLALLAMALATGNALYYRLTLGMLAAPLLGYLASALSARRIEGGVRRLTSYLQVGERLEERVTLRNTHWWPKLLLEAQHETAPFGRSGRIVTLWPFRSVEWTDSRRCERRGVYTFGELEITSRDPFGLFSRTMRLGRKREALIYPATVDLPGFHVPSGKGWTEGVMRGRAFTPSPIASGARDYTSADAVSRVHWPATAHAGRLIVKEFDPEPSGPADAVWVALDLDEGAQAGEGAESAEEYAVTTAASVAKRFLDGGRSVGAALAGRERVLIRPAAGVAQLGRIFQALALMEPGPGAGPDATAESLRGALSPGACVVLVSASPPAAVAPAVNRLRSAGAAVVPVAVDAASFGGGAPSAGGSGLDAYVIRKGDEIGKRLDYRSAPAGLAAVAPDPQAVPR